MRACYDSVMCRAISIAVLAVPLALLPAPAYAYLDPNSGSLLLQVLLGGFAGLAVLFRLYWKRLVQLFSRKRPGDDQQ